MSVKLSVSSSSANYRFLQLEKPKDPDHGPEPERAPLYSVHVGMHSLMWADDYMFVVGMSAQSRTFWRTKHSDCSLTSEIKKKIYLHSDLQSSRLQNASGDHVLVLTLTSGKSSHTSRANLKYSRRVHEHVRPPTFQASSSERPC